MGIPPKGSVNFSIYRNFCLGEFHPREVWASQFIEILCLWEFHPREAWASQFIEIFCLWEFHPREAWASQFIESLIYGNSTQGKFVLLIHKAADFSLILGLPPSGSEISTFMHFSFSISPNLSFRVGSSDSILYWIVINFHDSVTIQFDNLMHQNIN